MNKDQVKGRVEEVQGKIKEGVGKAVGNKDLEDKGNVQKNIGSVHGKLGDLKEHVKKAVKTP